MKAKEVMPGTWMVDYHYDHTTVKGIGVYLYAAGYWRCELCGVLQNSDIFCPHLEAVLNSTPTRCCDLEHPDCHEIACGDYRVDGVWTPLCPEHATALEKITA